jgi:8-oxo-dGTP diphosphatase
MPQPVDSVSGQRQTDWPSRDLHGARRVAALARSGVATVRSVTDDVELSYRWHESPVAGHLEIAKVYGFLICPDTGRALVQECEGSFSLPGGSPEPADADLSATLVREAAEESQVVVTRTAYLGYQEVRRPGAASYAQVRLVGLVGGFGPSCPDSDSGRMLRRLMCPLVDVPAVLGWGEIMVAQAALAARTAWILWGVPASTPQPAGYVD